MADIDIKSDLMIGIMNLIEMEHHARFSYLTTTDDKWLKILNADRETRAKYMIELEKDEEDSQLHCYNKHCLSWIFRAFEVGDKYLSEGNLEKAKEFYNVAYTYIEVFFGLNFNFEDENKESFFQKVKNKLK